LFKHDKPQRKLSLITELTALRQLHHPNIVQLKEVIDDGVNQNLFLVM
jgi:hypothetical protein